MLKFFKMHGIGNDYIFIDNQNNKQKINFGLLSKKICKRHFGVGSDGLIVIKNHKTLDAEMLIYNSDGSKANICGNATRCTAFYLSKKLGKKNISIFSGNKILNCKILKCNNQKAIVCVNMGSAKILKKAKNRAIVDIGNKHLVVLVKNYNFDVQKIGQKLSQKFCDGINVEFVKILSNDKIKIKVYERGSGITLACGSGACASCFALNQLFGLSKNILVKLDGGNLFVKIGTQIQMIGESKFVYKGEILC